MQTKLVTCDGCLAAAAPGTDMPKGWRTVRIAAIYTDNGSICFLAKMRDLCPDCLKLLNARTDPLNWRDR